MKSFMRQLVGALFFVVIYGATTARAEATSDLAKANQAYQAEHFAEAVSLYQAAVDAGTRNAALFYNLGNASFRAGDIGRAILNYQRALVLQPGHPEARANLHLAQDKARAPELPSNWWDRFADRATPDQLSIAMMVVFWIGIFCLAAWMLGRGRAPLRLLASVFALVVAGVLATALYALETGRNGRDLAIVIGEKVNARVATADNAGSVLGLPAGSEIKVLSRRGDWIYAALPNKQRGWILAGDAERVRL